MGILVLKQATGSSPEEAAKSVGFDFDLKFEATAKFKRALAKGPVTDFKAFAKDYLADKMKNIPNVGAFITFESAVEDSRERPYKEEVVSTTQKRKFKTVYQLVSDQQTILAEVEGTKEEARVVAKTLIKQERGAIKQIVARPIHVVSEGEDVAFTLEYTPSKSTKDGRYLFFAIAEEA